MEHMESRDGIGSRGLKTKLIINYLPQSMNDQDFRELFSAIGQVDSCRVMRDKATNYGFGYGFVDYVQPEDAIQAIEKLNGHHVMNKRLKVAYSKPPGSSKNLNLYVAGLAQNTDENKLKELFSIYGEIVTTKVLRENGQSKGAGFVLFKEKPHADAAMKALQNYSDGYGLNLKIKYAKESSEQQRSHPRYQEYVQRTHSYAQILTPSQYGGVLQYSVIDPAALGTPYGGGYANVEYGMPAQRPIRGRPQQGARYNPIARPVQGNAIAVIQDSPANVVFAYNIGPNATESDMYSLFSKYGRIVKVDVTDKGYAFIHMPIASEAAEAIRNLNGMYYNGKVLQVSLKGSK